MKHIIRNAKSDTERAAAQAALSRHQQTFGDYGAQKRPSFIALNWEVQLSR
ncbi:DUF4060 family protein [Edwardsiella piscicida]|nr:DUF4060 family protein [Edwardsiella piscicida]